MSKPIVQRISNTVFGDYSNGHAGVIAIGAFFVSLYVPSGTNSRLNIKVYRILNDNEIEVISDTEVNENGGSGGYTGYDFAYDEAKQAILVYYSWFNGPSHYVKGNVCTLNINGQVTVKPDVLLDINNNHDDVKLIYNYDREDFVLAYTISNTGYVRVANINNVSTGDISLWSVKVFSSDVLSLDLAYSKTDKVPVIMFSSYSHTEDIEMAVLTFDGIRYQLGVLTSIVDANVSSGDNLNHYCFLYNEVSNCFLIIFVNHTTGVEGLYSIIRTSGISVIAGLSSQLNIPFIQSYYYTEKEICEIPTAEIFFLAYQDESDNVRNAYLAIDGDSISVSVSEEDSVDSQGILISAWNDESERLMSFQSGYSLNFAAHILSQLYPDPFWRNNKGQSEKVNGSLIER